MAKKNRATAQDFIESGGYIFDACVAIEAAGGCERCPLKYACIRDSSTEYFLDSATMGAIEEMLDFADDVENFISEDDYIADLADMQRKGERDEYYD